MFNSYQPKRMRFLKKQILKLTYAVFTWRTRRMIFLSTLYGMVLNVRKADESHAKKLSEVLNIGREPSALEVPMALKSVIWRKKLPNEMNIQGRILRITDLTDPQLSDSDCESISSWIVGHMPDWLKYAKKTQMQYDIRRMSKMMQSNLVGA